MARIRSGDNKKYADQSLTEVMVQMAIEPFVWITLYTRDKFERFGNYLSIDEKRSSVCNVKQLYYVALVVLNGIGKISVVCGGFVTTENHDTCTFILESLFQMSISRNKKNIYPIFSDELMTQRILDSIGVQSTRIFIIIFICD